MIVDRKSKLFPMLHRSRIADNLRSGFGGPVRTAGVRFKNAPLTEFPIFE